VADFERIKMRIIRVGVTYGELRSTGYPSFSNVRHEASITAALEDGETGQDVIRKLEEFAKDEVKRRFGDATVAASEMEKPYKKPDNQ
jgi:hypothetical protein